MSTKVKKPNEQNWQPRSILPIYIQAPGWSAPQCCWWKRKVSHIGCLPSRSERTDGMHISGENQDFNLKKKKNLLGNNAALTNSFCISGQGTLTLSHSLPLLQNAVGNSFYCLAWRTICILPAFRRLKTHRCLIYFFTLDTNLTKPWFMF